MSSGIFLNYGVLGVSGKNEPEAAFVIFGLGSWSSINAAPLTVHQIGQGV